MANYRGENIAEIWGDRLTKYVDLSKITSLDSQGIANEIKEILRNPAQRRLGYENQLENFSKGNFAEESSKDEGFLQLIQKQNLLIKKGFITTKTGKKVTVYRAGSQSKEKGEKTGGRFISKTLAKIFGVQ